MNSRILVVDDDLALAEMIGIVLGSEGFDVATCSDGVQALDVFHQENPDLILLDVMLPGMDGIEICTRIRKESDVPIVMLTARTDTADVVAGLEAGADDYVPKPFKPKELVARVRARLRGREEAVDERLVLGDLVIDVSGHTIHRDPPDSPRIRLTRRPGARPLESLFPRGTSRESLGLPPRRRYAPCERSRAKTAVED